MMKPILISLFHTNDMHAHLDAMARLSHFARRLSSVAKREGRKVFFWDAGDAADRRIRLCSLTKGAGIYPILNIMGYTLQTMGNAISLPYGPQAMAAVAAQADFPILAANCRDGNDPLPKGLHESILLPLTKRVTLGVFGLTAPWSDAYEVFGLHFPDFCELAQRVVNDLKARQANPIILLSHLGLSDERLLSQKVLGLDLIIGGHSHNLLPDGEEVNGVLIAQAGSFAQSLGQVDLSLNPETGEIISRRAKVFCIPEDEAPDRRVTLAIESAEKKLEALMAQPIGVLETSLELDYFQECGIGNLAADALRERMKADLAIICSGLFHNGLPRGEVNLGDLDAACFSSANPFVSEIQGRQIHDALERGLQPCITQLQLHGFRGSPVGIPQVSGLMVEFDPNAADGQRVKRVFVQGQLLHLDHVYRVAYTDAETLPEVGYIRIEKGQPTECEVPTIVREVIEDYIRQHSPLPAPPGGRWRNISSMGHI